MSNTIIQIKRSSSTAAPANGSLATAELAYSYNSEKLFIGSANNAYVTEIGGKYWLDHTINAFNRANNGGTGSNVAFTRANVAFDRANLAYDAVNASATYTTSIVNASNSYTQYVGTSGNSYADLVGASSNSHAEYVAASANAHASEVYLTMDGGNITGDLNIGGSLVVSGTVTYANTQSLLIGDNILTLNADLPGDLSPTENAGIEVNRGNRQGNATIIWVEAANKWGFTSNNSLALNTYIASNTDLEIVRDSNWSNWQVTNTIYDMANVANALTTSTNTFIEAYTVAGNNYATYVGVSGNSYTDTITSSINNWIDVVTTAGNNYISTVNNELTAVATSANIYAGYVGFSANSYMNETNTVLIQTFSNAANIISGTLGTERLSGDYSGITGVGTLTSGTWNANTIDVMYGGTGVTSFSNNGVLFGNSSGSLRVAVSTLEGQVLQSTSAGTPEFAMLDGGSF